MTYTVVPYTTRQEWLELRRTGIGSSDVAAVVGVSPWTTPHQVWLQKVEPDAPEQMSNEDMEWGLKMERLVIQEACERLGADVVLGGPLVRNSEQAWMLATPDAIAEESAHDCNTDHPQCDVFHPAGDQFIIEAKKVDAWSWDEVPDYYQAQVQWQLAVTGLDRAVIAALHRGRRLELYEVERNEEVIQELVSTGERFWGLVESATPPPVEAGDNDYLGWLWPDHEEQAVEIPGELADELRAAKAAAKAADERLALASAQVKGLLEEADTAVVGQDVVATWRTQKANRLDVKALRAEEPDIADTYTRSSTSRVFRIKEPKE